MNIFIFTKKFPYAHQETYLFDELAVLSKKFKKIILIPHDEFNYNEDENRLIGLSNVEIFRMNRFIPKISFFNKIKREILVLEVFIKEIIYGRDFWLHVKNFRGSTSQLRTAYSQALGVIKYTKTENITPNLLYNYWLHRGAVISGFYNMLSSSSTLVVSRAHSYDLYHKNWFDIIPIKGKILNLYFEYWKVKSSNIIFPISKHGYKHLKSLYKSSKTKFEVSRLGVFSRGLTYSKQSIDDAFVLVSCSSITDNKRVVAIPEIISKVNCNVKWYHIGSGDSKIINSIYNRIEIFNLGTKCQILGNMSNESVLNFYKTNKVDLFLNLSIAEGIPVALMEAASFGIPMLGTKTVGTPEIVNNENGFLIDVDFDVDQVAKIIEDYLLQSDEIKNEKRKKSFETFNELYNAEKNYNLFADELEKLMNS
ncbi:MAG: glycosyltransferase [Luteibaculaceae bacterium]